jgi:hypothetical protein
MTAASLRPTIAEAIAQLALGDRKVHGRCYEILVTSMKPEPTWADSSWRQIEQMLRPKDNRVRSIAGQAMCTLAPAASRKQITRDLDGLIDATKDQNFVTARHVLLALTTPNSEVS